MVTTRVSLTALSLALACTAPRAAPAMFYEVTTLDDSGAGSLREAITLANGDAGPSTITFNVPGDEPPHTITLMSALPPLGSGNMIDAADQASPDGTPEVVLDGLSAGSAAGLVLDGSDSHVRGLSIQGFSVAGIQITGPGGCTVTGCDIGTSFGDQTGIEISNSANNTIGGFISPERNVISGNPIRGIYVSNSTGTRIVGNFIGPDRTGLAAPRGNALGIYVESTDTTIGGTEPGAGNVISGNTSHGIQLDGGSNVVQGNFIGLGADGIKPLGNAGDGVRVFNFFNQIGGSQVSARNLISANQGNGIHAGDAAETTITSNLLIAGNFIGSDVGGTNRRGNDGDGVLFEGRAMDSRVGDTGPGTGNLIVASGGAGIHISGLHAQRNAIYANSIGTDIPGTSSFLGNHEGVRIENLSSRNHIGAPDAFSRNIISGNQTGIFIQNSTLNTIQSNFIGTDQIGYHAQPNITGIGLYTGANQNTIGGTNPGEGNLISGNFSDGVLIFGDNNTVQGNVIGLAQDGVTPIPNRQSGVTITGITQNSVPHGINTVVGGDIPAARNVISGNQTGIAILAGLLPGITPTAAMVQGNYIGTDVTGMHAAPNTGSGVLISGAVSHNTIGGLNAGEGNVISGNGGNGVTDQSTEDIVEGNIIGLTAHGAMPLGNTLNGVNVTSAGQQCIIRRNAIFANGALGIDLGDSTSDAGVTDNDDFDTDTGANALQNFPVLQTASVASANLEITGSLQTLPNQTCAVEFFQSPGSDPSGHGEGMHFLTTIALSLGPSGFMSFDVVTPGSVDDGRFITATALDSHGNTSEFSAAIAIADTTPTAEEILYALLGIIAVQPDYNTNGDDVFDVADLVSVTPHP